MRYVQGVLGDDYAALMDNIYGDRLIQDEAEDEETGTFNHVVTLKVMPPLKNRFVEDFDPEDALSSSDSDGELAEEDELFAEESTEGISVRGIPSAEVALFDDIGESSESDSDDDAAASGVPQERAKIIAEMELNRVMIMVERSKTSRWRS